MLFPGKLKQKWEGICLECGQCCCEKVSGRLIAKQKRRISGTMSVNRRYFIDYSRPCSFLDIENGRCLVYEKRFKQCRSCIPMTIFHALFAGYLPENCGYVRKFRFWRKIRS